MDNIYQKKYLKYKDKYTQLKNLKGGGNDFIPYNKDDCIIIYKYEFDSSAYGGNYAWYEYIKGSNKELSEKLGFNKNDFFNKFKSLYETLDDNDIMNKLKKSSQLVLYGKDNNGEIINGYNIYSSNKLVQSLEENGVTTFDMNAKINYDQAFTMVDSDKAELAIMDKNNGFNSLQQGQYWVYDSEKVLPFFRPDLLKNVKDNSIFVGYLENTEDQIWYSINFNQFIISTRENDTAMPKEWNEEKKYWIFREAGFFDFQGYAGRTLGFVGGGSDLVNIFKLSLINFRNSNLYTSVENQIQAGFNEKMEQFEVELNNILLDEKDKQYAANDIIITYLKQMFSIPNDEKTAKYNLDQIFNYILVQGNADDKKLLEKCKDLGLTDSKDMCTQVRIEALERLKQQFDTINDNDLTYLSTTISEIKKYLTVIKEIVSNEDELKLIYEALINKESLDNIEKFIEKIAISKFLKDKNINFDMNTDEMSKININQISVIQGFIQNFKENILPYIIVNLKELNAYIEEILKISNDHSLNKIIFDAIFQNQTNEAIIKYIKKVEIIKLLNIFGIKFEIKEDPTFPNILGKINKDNLPLIESV